jgi:hypothetical protein
MNALWTTLVGFAPPPGAGSRTAVGPPLADLWRWLNAPFDWATSGNQTHTIQLALLGGCLALFILFRARK